MKMYPIERGREGERHSWPVNAGWSHVERGVYNENIPWGGGFHDMNHTARKHPWTGHPELRYLIDQHEGTELELEGSNHFSYGEFTRRRERGRERWEKEREDCDRGIYRSRQDIERGEFRQEWGDGHRSRSREFTPENRTKYKEDFDSRKRNHHYRVRSHSRNDRDKTAQYDQTKSRINQSESHFNKRNRNQSYAGFRRKNKSKESSSQDSLSRNISGYDSKRSQPTSALDKNKLNNNETDSEVSSQSSPVRSRNDERKNVSKLDNKSSDLSKTLFLNTEKVEREVDSIKTHGKSSSYDEKSDDEIVSVSSQEMRKDGTSPYSTGENNEITVITQVIGSTEVSVQNKHFSSVSLTDNVAVSVTCMINENTDKLVTQINKTSEAKTVASLESCCPSQKSSNDKGKDNSAAEDLALISSINDKLEAYRESIAATENGSSPQNRPCDKVIKPPSNIKDNTEKANMLKEGRDIASDKLSVADYHGPVERRKSKDLLNAYKESVPATENETSSRDRPCGMFISITSNMKDNNSEKTNLLKEGRKVVSDNLLKTVSHEPIERRRSKDLLDTKTAECDILGQILENENYSEILQSVSSSKTLKTVNKQSTSECHEKPVKNLVNTKENIMIKHSVESESNAIMSEKQRSSYKESDNKQKGELPSSSVKHHYKSDHFKQTSVIKNNETKYHKTVEHVNNGKTKSEHADKLARDKAFKQQKTEVEGILRETAVKPSISEAKNGRHKKPEEKESSAKMPKQFSTSENEIKTKQTDELSIHKSYKHQKSRKEGVTQEKDGVKRHLHAVDNIIGKKERDIRKSVNECGKKRESHDRETSSSKKTLVTSTPAKSKFDSTTNATAKVESRRNSKHFNADKNTDKIDDEMPSFKKVCLNKSQTVSERVNVFENHDNVYVKKNKETKLTEQKCFTEVSKELYQNNTGRTNIFESLIGTKSTLVSKNTAQPSSDKENVDITSHGMNAESAENKNAKQDYQVEGSLITDFDEEDMELIDINPSSTPLITTNIDLYEPPISDISEDEPESDYRKGNCQSVKYCDDRLFIEKANYCVKENKRKSSMTESDLELQDKAKRLKAEYQFSPNKTSEMVKEASVKKQLSESPRQKHYGERLENAMKGFDEPIAQGNIQESNQKRINQSKKKKNKKETDLKVDKHKAKKFLEKAAQRMKTCLKIDKKTTETPDKQVCSDEKNDVDNTYMSQDIDTNGAVFNHLNSPLHQKDNPGLLIPLGPVLKNGFCITYKLALKDEREVTTTGHLDPGKLLNREKCIKCEICMMYFSPLEFTRHHDSFEIMSSIDHEKCFEDRFKPQEEEILFCNKDSEKMWDDFKERLRDEQRLEDLAKVKEDKAKKEKAACGLSEESNARNAGTSDLSVFKESVTCNSSGLNEDIHTVEVKHESLVARAPSGPQTFLASYNNVTLKDSQIKYNEHNSSVENNCPKMNHDISVNMPKQPETAVLNTPEAPIGSDTSAKTPFENLSVPSEHLTISETILSHSQSDSVENYKGILKQTAFGLLTVNDLPCTSRTVLEDKTFFSNSFGDLQKEGKANEKPSAKQELELTADRPSPVLDASLLSEDELLQELRKKFNISADDTDYSNMLLGHRLQIRSSRRWLQRRTQQITSMKDKEKMVEEMTKLRKQKEVIEINTRCSKELEQVRNLKAANSI